MIHRYWRPAPGAPRPPIGPWLAAVIRQLHPNEVVRDWTDETLPVALVERLAADPLTDPRHRANIARWWLLEMYGGIWLDHDVIPLRTLPDGAWTATLPGARTAAVMRLPLGHDLPAMMLDAIDRTPRRGMALPDISGDRVLGRVAHHLRGVDAHLLPFDAAGRPVAGASPWCVHLWSTSSRKVLV